MRKLLLVVLVLVAACSTHDEVAPPAPEAEAEVVIRTAGGAVELDVELADTGEERATGLMGRQDIGPHDGMAFTFGSPTDGTFWMKNTLIPLSIAFWDESGRIVGILDMEPCTADPCPTYGPGVPYIGALELQQGAFAEHGVEVGDRLELTTPGHR
jgi:uncharacterized membrane protein (UPF0127 family)